jgi:polyphosphate kinase 2 (PPK2 family)
MSDHPSIEDVRAATIVDPKARKSFSLKDRDTRGDKLFEHKKEAKASLDKDALAINELQDALFASKAGALLVVMQGIDTSGKDGTTKEAFRYTSPLGVNVFAFGKPTEEELAHDYLWRLHRCTPKRGYIHVFNRSQYEDVLVVRVRNLAPAKQVEQRYEQINAFEKLLTENGTSRRMSRVSACASGWRFPRSAGNSTPTTSRTASCGTPIRLPTRPCSSVARRLMRHGM